MAHSLKGTGMLIAAIICALIGFGLLVAAVQSPDDIYTWALLAVCALGLVLFTIDWVKKHRGRTRPDDDNTTTTPTSSNPTTTN